MDFDEGEWKSDQWSNKIIEDFCFQTQISKHKQKDLQKTKINEKPLKSKRKKRSKTKEKECCIQKNSIDIPVVDTCESVKTASSPKLENIPKKSRRNKYYHMVLSAGSDKTSEEKQEKTNPNASNDRLQPNSCNTPIEGTVSSCPMKAKGQSQSRKIHKKVKESSEQDSKTPETCNSRTSDRKRKHVKKVKESSEQDSKIPETLDKKRKHDRVDTFESRKSNTAEIDTPEIVPQSKKRKNANSKAGVSMEESASVTVSTKPPKAKFDVNKLKTVLSKEEQRTTSISSKNLVKDNTSTPSTTRAKGTLSLRERMQQKLNSARFRYLNEQLYSVSGSEAYKMFQDDENAFSVYHDGFQEQVSKWPENPVDRVITHIGKKSPSQVIADFGCGDAKVAAGVPNKVHSFDLVAVNPRVTPCDMSQVPLKNGSVDVAVFCLSLMGTNVVDFLTEAQRVLKKGGHLLIAEVQSRFEKISYFIKKMQRLGFILVQKDLSNRMFVWMEFKKVGDIIAKPQIDLLPCIYKRR